MSGQAGQVRPTKIKVVPLKKGELDDKKIPRQLIIKYGETHYILKAGLEWKATSLFGVGGYSLVLKRMETKEGEVFRATMRILETGALFVNFGEATVKNTNKMMVGQLLHLAATRAECRVLRMATACGYASYEELRTIEDNNNKVEATVIEGGDKPATVNQIQTIKSLLKAKGLDGEKPAIVEFKGITKQQAADTLKKITSMRAKKKGK